MAKHRLTGRVEELERRSHPAGTGRLRWIVAGVGETAKQAHDRCNADGGLDGYTGAIVWRSPDEGGAQCHA